MKFIKILPSIICMEFIFGIQVCLRLKPALDEEAGPMIYIVVNDNCPEGHYLHWYDNDPHIIPSSYYELKSTVAKILEMPRECEVSFILANSNTAITLDNFQDILESLEKEAKEHPELTNTNILYLKSKLNK